MLEAMKKAGWYVHGRICPHTPLVLNLTTSLTSDVVAATSEVDPESFFVCAQGPISGAYDAQAHEVRSGENEAPSSFLPYGCDTSIQIPSSGIPV
jgi:predicted TIM-barrel enzyme